MKACNNADNDFLIDMNTVCHNLYFNLTDEGKDDPNVLRHFVNFLTLGFHLIFVLK